MENNTYEIAKARVEKIKKFYGKVQSFLITIIIVATINYYLNEWAYPWFLWVVFGLGISLALKAIKIFNLNPFMGRNWEERKIQEYMQQNENKRPWK